MVLTGSSGNGSLLGWELGPLRLSAKLWLHDAGITHVHELVSGGLFQEVNGRCYTCATVSVRGTSRELSPPVLFG